jgi:hypothetical protein
MKRTYDIQSVNMSLFYDDGVHVLFADLILHRAAAIARLFCFMESTMNRQLVPSALVDISDLVRYQLLIFGVKSLRDTNRNSSRHCTKYRRSKRLVERCLEKVSERGLSALTWIKDQDEKQCDPLSRSHCLSSSSFSPFSSFASSSSSCHRRPFRQGPDRKHLNGALRRVPRHRFGRSISQSQCSRKSEMGTPSAGLRRWR